MINKCSGTVGLGRVDLHRGTAAAPVLTVVMRNDESAILNAFAVVEQTPSVSGLEMVSIARGCRRAADLDAFKQGCRGGVDQRGPDGAGNSDLPQLPPPF